MAAPTQELPSWLSYIPTTITDGNGNVFTSSTLVYLPLTYYGPSIPLGPDWTYGGLTSPAPTTTSTDATAEPSTIITTTPTTSSAIPSTTSSTSVIPPSTSNSSSSPTSSSSSPSTFSASTSRGGPTSSATVAPIPSGGLERGQLVGIIVGSILAAIAIFLLVLICCLKRRRQRENRHSPSHSPEALDEWQIPHRSPNLRSGEADPFLDPTATGTASAAVAVAGPSRPRGGRRSSVPTTINDGSLSSGSNQSGYGTILEQPSLNLAPVPPPFEEEHNRPWQLRTLDEEESDDDHMYPEPGMVAAADLPPRLVGATQSEKSFHSRRTQRSSYPIDGDEPATLETARRIRVDGPRASPETRTLPLDEHDNDEPEPTRGMLGLTSLANLGRFSWFRNWDSLSRRHSAAADDLESGAALLGDAPPVTEMGERRRSRLGAGILGLTAEGSRPISDVSAKSATSGSGGTVYHDADSSLPSTPLLTPPPRALASTTEHNVRWARTESDYLTPVDQPPPTLALTPTSSHTAATGTQNVDILDLPAPKGISPFGSTASVHALPSPKAWNDTMGDTPSIGSFAANSEGTAGHGITIDVLEEDPPAATDTWRTMASVLGPPGARTTFGIPLVTQPADLTSEIGSLHSMRSHLSPRSTGSAPASREGSGSSGARSKSPSSLAHSGSVSLSSEERSPRSRVGGGPVSPALSAFGARGPGPVSPERAHLSDVDAVHGHGHPVDRRRALDDTRSQSPPLSPLLMSPWIGGLDADWQAT